MRYYTRSADPAMGSGDTGGARRGDRRRSSNHGVRSTSSSTRGRTNRSARSSARSGRRARLAADARSRHLASHAAVEARAIASASCAARQLTTRFALPLDVDTGITKRAKVRRLDAGRHPGGGRRPSRVGAVGRRASARRASIFSRPTRGITCGSPRARSATSRIASPSIPYAAPDGQYVAVAPLLDTIIATAVVRHAGPRCADAIHRARRGDGAGDHRRARGVRGVGAGDRCVRSPRRLDRRPARRGPARTLPRSHAGRLRRSPRARSAAVVCDAGLHRLRLRDRRRRLPRPVSAGVGERLVFRLHPRGLAGRSPRSSRRRTAPSAARFTAISGGDRARDRGRRSRIRHCSATTRRSPRCSD